jgi:hypothetical protein
MKWMGILVIHRTTFVIFVDALGGCEGWGAGLYRCYAAAVIRVKRTIVGDDASSTSPKQHVVVCSCRKECCMRTEKELAIKNYEKSLELDPKNSNAVEMLKTLHQ